MWRTRMYTDGSGQYLRPMRPLTPFLSAPVLGAALLVSSLVGPAAAAPAPMADAIPGAVASSAPAASPHDRSATHPRRVKVDFVMRMEADSASFVLADRPGEYQLTLRGASPHVRVTELTTAEESASLPLKALMAYWTAYGDVTGQFKKNPPRAVVQGTDAAGNLVEVVVRLRDASRQDAMVRFDAEVITNPTGLRKVKAKVDDVDETDVGEYASAPDPERLTGIELFVDMPPKITQPEEEADGMGAAVLGRRAGATRALMPRTLTCNGVRSSRLTTCWNDITPEQAQTWPGKWVKMIDTKATDYSQIFYQQFKPDFPGGPENGWIYENVGVVDWGNYYWNPGKQFYSGGYRQLERDAEGRRTLIAFAKHRTWYGVDTEAVTWFATDRCTWFVARWTPGGSCW